MANATGSKKGGKNAKKNVKPLSLVLASAPLPTIAFIAPLSGVIITVNTPVNANGFCSGVLGAAGLNGVLVSASDDTIFFPLAVIVSGAKSTAWQAMFGAPAAGNWILQIWSAAGGAFTHAEITITAH